MKKLFELPEKQNIKLYLDDKVIIFDHLDYITNLQQENETRQQDINNLTYQLAKVKEENERLKLEYKSQKNINQKLLSMDIKHNRELKDYKSRCKKASAELKDWEKLDLDNLLVAIRRMQNILQDGSDDNDK